MTANCTLSPRADPIVRPGIIASRSLRLIVASPCLMALIGKRLAANGGPPLTSRIATNSTSSALTNGSKLELILTVTSTPSEACCCWIATLALSSSRLESACVWSPGLAEILARKRLIQPCAWSKLFARASPIAMSICAPSCSGLVANNSSSTRRLLASSWPWLAKKLICA